MAYDSQIARANENLKLSHGGPRQRQASGTNQRIFIGFIFYIFHADVNL